MDERMMMEEEKGGEIWEEQQQPVGEESPLGELPAGDLSCSCRKSYTPAAVLT
jgi:hypothetical protein